jgi:hypothetical protein
LQEDLPGKFKPLLSSFFDLLEKTVIAGDQHLVKTPGRTTIGPTPA